MTDYKLVVGCRETLATFVYNSDDKSLSRHASKAVTDLSCVVPWRDRILVSEEPKARAYTWDLRGLEVPLKKRFAAGASMDDVWFLASDGAVVSYDDNSDGPSPSVVRPADRLDLELLHFEHHLHCPLGARVVGISQQREHLFGDDLPR